MNNKEEVLDVNQTEKPVTPNATVYSSAPIKEATPVYHPAMENLGPVDAEANKPKEAAPVYHPAMDDLGPVDAEKNKAFTPTIESLTPPIDEKTAIKETQSATPNKLDDPSLKVEDKMKSSEIKTLTKKLPDLTPEENKKDSSRKIAWLIGMALFIGLVMLLIPLFVKI
jgi:hypothetical protein